MYLYCFCGLESFSWGKNLFDVISLGNINVLRIVIFE